MGGQALILLLSFAIVGVVSGEGEMKYALDGMQLLMEGDGVFDEDLYASLVGCFDKYDDLLMEAQDVEWDGMMTYAAMGGIPPGDPWLTCQESEEQGITEGEVWSEFNCTVQVMGDMSIYEPCNYASNVAYYHTMLEICRHDDEGGVWRLPQEYILAMVQNYAYLAQGSAFFHGSQTDLGGASDVKLNDLFTFLAYQAATSNLAPLDSSIVHDLSIEPRSMTVFETTAYLQDVFLNQPIEEWEDEINGIDVPTIYVGMCAFFATSFSLVIEDETLDQVVPFLMNLLGVDEADTEFCVEVFLPEIEAATADIVLTGDQEERLVTSVVGTVLKLFYGIIWQEELLPLDIFFSPEANEIGARLLPLFNDVANSILPADDFPHYNPDLQHGVGVYPGEEWCNPTIPHAKWHLQTGIALADFAHLSDVLYDLLDTAGDGGESGGGGEGEGTAPGSAISFGPASVLPLFLVAAAVPHLF